MNRLLDEKCKLLAESRRRLWVEYPSSVPENIPNRLLIVPGGKMAFCELNAVAGKMSKEKREIVEKITKMGATVLVIWKLWHLEQMLDKWIPETNSPPV